MTAKTVEKSLLLLESLARSSEPRGVAELSRELGMPKSNVFRLLDTFALHRYVHRRPEDNRYELTLKLWELGSSVLARTNLTEVAREYLEELAARSKESVHLAVLDDGESVYIDKRDGQNPIRGVTKIGSRAPAHACATGKTELAYQPADVVGRVASRLVRFTDATITTRQALLRELEGIRARGFAVNRGEWYQHVWGIAAPIRNGAGEVMASVGIWGPKDRLAKATSTSARLVIAAADGISAAFGFKRELSTATTTRRTSK